MKKIQYILLASLAIGAGASAASLPEEAAAMAEQFLSQKMGGKTADGGSLTAAVMSTSDKAVKKTKSLKKAEFYAYNAPQGGFVLMSANGDDLRVDGLLHRCQAVVRQYAGSVAGMDGGLQGSHSLF